MPRPAPGNRAKSMTGRTAVDDFRQVIDLDHATSDDTVRLARTAAEAVRGLNHLTGHDADLGQPSAAYDITGALALAGDLDAAQQQLALINGIPPNRKDQP